jgi:hypothetical protein
LSLLTFPSVLTKYFIFVALILLLFHFARVCVSAPYVSISLEYTLQIAVLLCFWIPASGSSFFYSLIKLEALCIQTLHCMQIRKVQFPFNVFNQFSTISVNSNCLPVNCERGEGEVEYCVGLRRRNVRREGKLCPFYVISPSVTFFGTLLHKLGNIYTCIDLLSGFSF